MRWTMRNGIAIVALLAIAAGSASPSHAEPDPAASTEAVVGDFGLGDGLEGGIDEQTGDFSFAVSVGGVPLAWNSARLGVDRYGLGAGWSWRAGFVDTDGGVRVFPARGGVYEVDASAPTGLRGYAGADLVFEQRPGGRLPGRAGIGEQEFAFVLHELGGVRTFFAATGDPVARISATGRRSDWSWSADAPHRLIAMVTPDGVRTELDWLDDRDEITVRPAANVGDRADGAGVEWHIALRDGRVGRVTDPMGGRIDAVTDASGLVTAIEGQSGATTEIRWRARDDGTAQIDEVELSDASGTLSRRRFSGADASPSGWPLHPTAVSAFGAGTAMSTTELSDGRTRIVSTSNSLGLLVSRRVVVTTPGGDRDLQAQRFEYPVTDEQGRPNTPASALPTVWAAPTSATVVHADATGATRESRQTVSYDHLGRPVEVVAADGTRTVTRYDEVVPAAAPDSPTAGAATLPIGLPVARRSVAPDGWTTEVRSELNAARTAPVVTEQLAAPPGEPLGRVSRTEFAVDADGFVAERRVYPDGDPERAPTVSRWHRALDLGAGLSTLTAELAAGTPEQTATSSVASLAHGDVVQTIDAAGRVASAELDELGRVRRSIDHAGRVTTLKYQNAQIHGRNAVTVTTPDGVATTTLRDALGRVRQVTDNVHNGAVEAGHTRVRETRTYPDPATVRVTDAWGATSTMRQDVYGRTVETVGPDGLRRLVEHDDVGMTTRAGITPTTSLDHADLVGVDRRDASGRVVHTASARADGLPTAASDLIYDGLGRLVAASDGDAESTTEYDRFGRPARTSFAADGAELVAASTFDGFGAAVEQTLTDRDTVTPRSGGTRELDRLGRSTQLRDQLGRATAVEYTADGRPALVTGPSGETTAYRYDSRTGQVTEAVATNAAGDRVATAYEYDPATGRTTAILDPDDPVRTRIEYAYDADGNLLATRYPDGRRITHEYDAHGRKTATTDVAGNVTSYEYDEVGRLASATQVGGGEPASAIAEVRYGYDDHGRLARIERGNGVRTNIDHDSAGLVTAQRTERDGVAIADRAYEYDIHGNVTLRTDTLHRSGATSSTSTSYRYDGLDRLTGSTVHAGASADAPVSRRTDYRATPAADVAEEIVTEQPGSPEQRVTSRLYDYNALGELDAVTLTRDGEVQVLEQRYDAAGNLVRGHDGSAYVYDAANRVVRQTTADGETITTEYWADGSRKRRATSRTDGEAPHATTTYWDGGLLTNDHHVGPAATRTAGTGSYLLGLQREARTVATADGQLQTSYVVTDRHGSVTETTDDLGAVAEQFTYSDYGVGSTGTPATAGIGDPGYQPFRFAGELTDGDGTQYLHARVYDPETKRFHTRDLASRINLYHYADANPIVKLDPSGRSPVLDFALTMAGYALTIGALAAVPFSGGSTLAMVGALAAAGADAAIATLTVIDQRAVDFIPDDWALGLAITSAVIGVVSAAASVADLVATRIARRAAVRLRAGSTSTADTPGPEAGGGTTGDAPGGGTPGGGTPPPSPRAHPYDPPPTSVWYEPPPVHTQTFVPEDVETTLPLASVDPVPEAEVFSSSYAKVSPVASAQPTPTPSPNWSPIGSPRTSRTSSNAIEPAGSFVIPSSPASSPDLTIRSPLEPPREIVRSSQGSAIAADSAAFPADPLVEASIIGHAQSYVTAAVGTVQTNLGGLTTAAQQAVTQVGSFFGSVSQRWGDSLTNFLNTPVHNLPDAPVNLGSTARLLAER